MGEITPPPCLQRKQKVHPATLTMGAWSPSGGYAMIITTGPLWLAHENSGAERYQTVIKMSAMLTITSHVVCLQKLIEGISFLEFWTCFNVKQSPVENIYSDVILCKQILIVCWLGLDFVSFCCYCVCCLKAVSANVWWASWENVYL